MISDQIVSLMSSMSIIDKKQGNHFKKVFLNTKIIAIINYWLN